MKTLVIIHDNKSGCTIDRAGTTDYQVKSEQEASEIIHKYISNGVKVFRWYIF